MQASFAVFSILMAGAQSQQESGAAAALRGFTSPPPSSTTTAVVQCDTSVGELTIDVKGHWAPRGARRFLEMVWPLVFVSSLDHSFHLLVIATYIVAAVSSSSPYSSSSSLRRWMGTGLKTYTCQEWCGTT